MNCYERTTTYFIDSKFLPKLVNFACFEKTVSQSTKVLDFLHFQKLGTESVAISVHFSDLLIW